MATKRKNKIKKQRAHKQKFENYSTKGIKIKGISKSDKQLDMMSDNISGIVKSNWSNYGVCFINNKQSQGFTKLSYGQRLSSKMFQTFGDIKRFFHITSPLNWSKIQNDGLKSVGVNHNTIYGGNGNIYVIQSSDKDVWNYIGYNQLGNGVIGLKMVVIEVLIEGITGKLFSEEGGEYTTPLHTVIEQNVIEPKYLKKIYEFNTSRTEFYKFRPTIKKLKEDFLHEKFKTTEGFILNNLIPFKNAG